MNRCSVALSPSGRSEKIQAVLQRTALYYGCTVYRRINGDYRPVGVLQGGKQRDNELLLLIISHAHQKIKTISFKDKYYLREAAAYLRLTTLIPFHMSLSSLIRLGSEESVFPRPPPNLERSIVSFNRVSSLPISLQLPAIIRFRRVLVDASLPLLYATLFNVGHRKQRLQIFHDPCWTEIQDRWYDSLSQAGRAVFQLREQSKPHSLTGAAMFDILVSGLWLSLAVVLNTGRVICMKEPARVEGPVRPLRPGEKKLDGQNIDAYFTHQSKMARQLTLEDMSDLCNYPPKVAMPPRKKRMISGSFPLLESDGSFPLLESQGSREPLPDCSSPLPAPLFLPDEEEELSDKQIRRSHIDLLFIDEDKWTDDLLNDYFQRPWRQAIGDPRLVRITHFKRYGADLRYLFKCQFASRKHHRTTITCWIKWKCIIGNSNYLSVLVQVHNWIPSKMGKMFIGDIPLEYSGGDMGVDDDPQVMTNSDDVPIYPIGKLKKL